MSGGRFAPAAAHILQLPPVFVAVDPETAAWVMNECNVRSVITARGRDANRRVLQRLLALVEIAELGSVVGADDGTNLTPTPVHAGQLSVKGAASLIGVGERAVRRAIAEDRLKAHIVGGIHVIDERDALAYKPRRTAA